MLFVVICIIVLMLHKAEFIKKGVNSNYLSAEMSNSIKGICAILIILHHISQRLEKPGLLIIFRGIGYLVVCIFFFYSGYGLIISLRNKENYLDNFLKKRLSKILIPFWNINILYLVVNSILGEKYTLADILKYLFGVKLINSTAWYVIAIIVFYFGFYISFKYFSGKSSLAVLAFVILIYCISCRILGLQLLRYTTSLAFYLSILYGIYVDQINKIMKNNFILIASISVIVFFISYYFKNKILIFNFISQISFLVIFLSIIMKVRIHNKITSFIGSISYEIYLVHKLIVTLLFTVITNSSVYIITTVLITLLIAYMINIIDKTILRRLAKN